MFPVHLVTDQNNIPEDNLCYLVGQNGFFTKKKNFLGEGIFKTSEISHLKPLQEGVLWQLPKIPMSVFYSVLKTFQKINNDYGKVECVALLLLDNNTQEYFFKIPEQKVTKTSVVITGSWDYGENVYVVGMFHNNKTVYKLRSFAHLLDGVHVLVDINFLPKIETYMVMNEKDMKVSTKTIFEGEIYQRPSTKWLDRVTKNTTHFSQKSGYGGNSFDPWVGYYGVIE